ncbi:hypothetical protein L227DRAFT_617687 [Lentinus tigrinus ALCF2SS1-6]|uniref:Uncharacterized protein n=1 Tax=Lentinus tigrinus ALCF2SS1-6 TaxID=1328759 RepID=A0A5C2RNW0_9APHY|nr:hypothetical protein L227DRAFT_617687 [Lentinus tigrinus ALCF2SS1-6]
MAVYSQRSGTLMVHRHGYGVDPATRSSDPAVLQAPLFSSLFTLSSVVAGFFGGNGAVSGMTTLANSRLWDGLFPGDKREPAELFGLNGRSGPMFHSVCSGSSIPHTGHRANTSSSPHLAFWPPLSPYLELAQRFVLPGGSHIARSYLKHRQSHTPGSQFPSTPSYSTSSLASRPLQSTLSSVHVQGEREGDRGEDTEPLEGADKEQSDADVAPETSGDVAEAGQGRAGLQLARRRRFGTEMENLATTQVSLRVLDTRSDAARARGPPLPSSRPSQRTCATCTLSDVAAQAGGVLPSF